ncbi:MAG TPA: GDP-mannose 4,6-dehydratase [Candidatus Angelobacter sp.]|nr:GDP-mannose 4,6-dehydratase [Candidatus Angelobacter sp.]
MNVMVTGGAGFIGSHVAETLLRQGNNVAVIDNFDGFYSPAWKRRNLEEVALSGNVALFEADICDQKALDHVFNSFHTDLIIHLAARAGVRPSIEQPEIYERVNVAGTLNLLEAARNQRVKGFVFGSSSSVYGESSPAPFREDNYFLRPISPYAATKLAGESLCYTYYHLYRLNIACLRFFTVYGPRQRPDLAIHKFISLIENGGDIPIFGDGSTGRDYTYVDDIVAGVLCAAGWCMKQPSEAGRYEIFNLGNSSPVRLNELVAAIEKVMDKKARCKILPAQPGDVPLTWADISKAGSILNYRPCKKLEEGLSRFVEWFRQLPLALRA